MTSSHQERQCLYSDWLEYLQSQEERTGSFAVAARVTFQAAPSGQGESTVAVCFVTAKEAVSIFYSHFMFPLFNFYVYEHMETVQQAS